MPAVAKKPGVDESKSKRPPSMGKTVRLRAIALGQYGRPISNLITPGTVFLMAVADLEVREKVLGWANQTKDAGAREARVRAVEARKTMDVSSVTYVLPTWTVDAATPIDEDESLDGNELAASAGSSDESVI